MKRILVALAVLAGLVAGAAAIVWLVPSVQDRLVKRGRRLHQGKHSSLP